MSERHGLWEYSRFPRVLALFASLLGLMLALPLLEDPYSAPLLLGMLLTLVIGTGIFAVAEGRRSLIIGTLLGQPALVIYLLDVTGVLPGHLTLLDDMLLALVCFWVIGGLLRSLATPRSGDGLEILGPVCIVLLFAVSWTGLYGLVDIIYPGSVAAETGLRAGSSFVDFLYYSFVAIGSMGQMRVLPLSSPASSLIWTEVALAFFLLVSMLVCYESRANPGRGAMAPETTTA